VVVARREADRLRQAGIDRPGYLSDRPGCKRPARDHLLARHRDRPDLVGDVSRQGSDPRQLTSSPQNELDPAWSARNGKIAYTVEPTDKSSDRPFSKPPRRFLETVPLHLERVVAAGRQQAERASIGSGRAVKTPPQPRRWWN